MLVFSKCHDLSHLPFTMLFHRPAMEYYVLTLLRIEKEKKNDKSFKF